MTSQATSPAPRVLIVGDDVSASDMFCRTLRLEGFEVWGALSAREGLLLAEKHAPHAIVVDLRIPLTTGVGLLRDFRSRPALRHTPIALVSGDYFPPGDTSDTIGALGATLHFKPVWLHELVGLARELVHASVSR